MNTTMKILAGLEFSSLIAEAQATTATGSEMLNTYKSYLMMKESSCGLVNNFVKEAQACRYDNGVNRVLETVADYINSNKTSWALASACENINANSQSYNYLNRNAAKQVEKLLEMDESDVVSYIKAGALKNVMFCESFRTIAKQVFKDNPIVESTAEFKVIHPVSMIESVGDGLCFEVNGTLYKMGDDKNVQEAQWNEVSNTFRVISSLLESGHAEISNGDIEVKAGNSIYTISEAGKCKKCCKKGAKGEECKEEELSAEQLRENNRLVLMACSPAVRNNLAGVLEAIALTCENYDNIVNMDIVSIYETKRDRFMVVEAGDNLYATLLASTRSPKWTVNEDIMKTISFIKDRTNVSLNEQYAEKIKAVVEKVSKEEKAKIEEEIHNNTIESFKDRVATLTEKFKNDPAKLAVLAKVAQSLSEE